MSETLTELEQLVLEEDEGFPLNLPAVQKAQQTELNMKNSELKLVINDKKPRYNISTLDDIELVTYKDKIYVPITLRKEDLRMVMLFLKSS